MRRFINEVGGGDGAGSSGGSASAGGGIIATSNDTGHASGATVTADFARIIGPQQRLLKRVKKIRRQKIKESANDKAYYVGNCVTDFDGDGNCEQVELPWRDTTDMAQALEHPKYITKEQFDSEVEVPLEIEKQIKDHQRKYGLTQGVFFILDVDDDVHYFFVR